jgi:hypothetical protein
MDTDYGIIDANKPVFWWKEPKDNAHKAIFSTVTAIRKRSSAHWDAMRVNYRLYGFMDNYAISNWESMASDMNGYMSKIRLNVIKMVCETAQARIAKNRPRPQFLTQEGSYSKKSMGKKLGAFVEGVYYENDTYAKAQDSFLFSAITGAGAIKLIKEISGSTGKVKHEVAFPHELVLDPEEQKSGVCYTMYQVKMLNKYDLADIYEKKEILMSSVAGAEFSDVYGYSDNIFSVPVIEAWRVPVGKQKGRHIICTDSCVILDEEWKHKKPPFEFFPYGVSLFGVFGQGIASNTKGIQLELNKTLKDIQSIIHLGAVPKIFVDENTRVVSAHLNNEIGTIIKIAGSLSGIKQDQLMRVPAELWQQVDFMYNKAHDINGLTLTASTGMKPPGLDSGRALREYNDIEQERFSIVAQNYERFHMNLWKHTIDYAKEVSTEGKKFSVMSFNRKGMNNIKWNDIDLKDNEYVMQLHAVGFLSKHPSGRIDDVEKLINIGVVDKEQSQDLLEFPDIDGFYSEVNAYRRSFEKIIEGIVEKSEYMPPSPMYGDVFLQKGIEFMRSMFFLYSNEGLEQEKLELVTQWISDAMGIIEELQLQAMPQEEKPSFDQFKEGVLEEMNQGEMEPGLEELTNQGEVPDDIQGV